MVLISIYISMNKLAHGVHTAILHMDYDFLIK